MALTVTPYGPEHVPLVKAFNKRLLDKGDRNQFPESHIPSWLPKRPGYDLYQELFVLRDEENVRGGFILKHQHFWLNGRQLRIANMQLPISEGIVDPRYTIVGVIIARNAVEKAPVMYSLGMGGYSEAITRLLKALRWKLISVPFYFKVINCNNFLRKNAYLRTSPSRKFVLDVYARTGIGAASVHALQFLRQEKFSKQSGAMSQVEVKECDEEIDRIWTDVRSTYKLIAVRDSRTMDILYPPAEKRFRRIKVYSNGTCIGWYVTLCTQMTTHKQFGSLRVGSVVDCLSHPRHALLIIRAAAEALTEQGADIIVANHSHHMWGRAFARNGFLRGPSNFIFGASVALTKLLDGCDSACREIYFMRGDGDGPINL